jgi:hypothetical protein
VSEPSGTSADLTQCVLDPKNPPGTGIWKPELSLPHELLEFGKYPNVKTWEAGDLLLFSPTEPDWIARSIIAAQQERHAKSHARWTHAAIYLGDEVTMCHSDFGPGSSWGVSNEYMFEYIGKHHLLRVRRVPKLPPEARARIALSAVARTGAMYNFRGLIGLGMKYLIKPPTRNRLGATVSAGSVICSRLFSDAYLEVTDIRLLDKSIGEATPAFLSQTSHLENVPTEWLTIDGCEPQSPIPATTGKETLTTESKDEPS